MIADTESNIWTSDDEEKYRASLKKQRRDRIAENFLCALLSSNVVNYSRSDFVEAAFKYADEFIAEADRDETTR